MFILLNGSFGIGKTTVAELFVRQVPEASLFDPEAIGFVLRRMPAFMLGLSQQPEDYQDLALWRRLIVIGARLRHRGGHKVIVPMTFTNFGYFEEFATRLGATAPVHRLCLVAPLEIVRARLEDRATREQRDVTAFELRRSAESVAAHADRRFGTALDATGSPAQIVQQIRALVGA